MYIRRSEGAEFLQQQNGDVLPAKVLDAINIGAHSIEAIVGRPLFAMSLAQADFSHCLGDVKFIRMRGARR